MANRMTCSWCGNEQPEQTKRIWYPICKCGHFFQPLEDIPHDVACVQTIEEEFIEDAFGQDINDLMDPW